MKKAAMVGIGLVLASGAIAGEAGSYSSLKTALDLKKCKEIGNEELGSTHACSGHRGMPMLALEGDSRWALSYGPNAEQEPAAKVFFYPLNEFGNKIEWRLGPQGNAPFATIVHWNIWVSEKNPTGVLVVTRLPPGPVCHVAYIDAVANPNANDLARKAADEKARAFRCGEEKPAIVGKPGKGTRALGVETAEE